MADIVSMYGFKLNPRESAYIMDRMYTEGWALPEEIIQRTAMYLNAVVKDYDPMFEPMSVQLIGPELLPEGVYERIPGAYPYMFVFGLSVPQGTTLEDLGAIYRSHPMFDAIRTLRRFFRERLGLRLQFTSDQAGLWTGYQLPRAALDVGGRVSSTD
jgi:hypothetical protein